MNSLVDRRLHPRLGVLATAAAALGAAVAAITLLVPGHGFGALSAAQPTLAPASPASTTGSSGSGHLSRDLARLASSDPRRQVQVIIQLAPVSTRGAAGISRARLAADPVRFAAR